MAEYSKKTVAELQEILKSRGLASSGKKADLVARLNEADKAAESEGKLAQTFTQQTHSPLSSLSAMTLADLSESTFHHT